MKLKQLLEDNSIARTNALKKQQELVDAGYENIEVKKLPGGVYQLGRWWFCTSDGRVEKYNLDTTQLLTNSSQAFSYAEYILKGPFLEGEPVIATSASHAYRYAEYILKGPFPAGEPTIATNSYCAFHYTRYVLKGPFPAGEPVIATDAYYAYYYAKNILKAPFPAGELEIMKSKHKAEYEEFLASLKP